MFLYQPSVYTETIDVSHHHALNNTFDPFYVLGSSHVLPHSNVLVTSRDKQGYCSNDVKYRVLSVVGAIAQLAVSLPSMREVLGWSSSMS